MARIPQQVSRAFVTINERTHNGWHSTIDEVEEQARWLYNVEQNINIVWTAMKQVKAMMMHMAQSLQGQPL